MESFHQNVGSRDSGRLFKNRSQREIALTMMTFGVDALLEHFSLCFL